MCSSEDGASAELTSRYFLRVHPQMDGQALSEHSAPPQIRTRSLANKLQPTRWKRQVPQRCCLATDKNQDCITAAAAYEQKAFGLFHCSSESGPFLLPAHPPTHLTLAPSLPRTSSTAPSGTLHESSNKKRVQPTRRN